MGEERGLGISCLFVQRVLLGQVLGTVAGNRTEQDRQDPQLHSSHLLGVGEGERRKILNKKAMK